MFGQQSRRLVGYRKHVLDTSLVQTAASCAQADDGQPSKPTWQPRRENTGHPSGARPGRMSAFSGHVRTRRETLRFSFYWAFFL